MVSPWTQVRDEFLGLTIEVGRYIGFVARNEEIGELAQRVRYGDMRITQRLSLPLQNIPVQRLKLVQLVLGLEYLG